MKTVIGMLKADLGEITVAGEKVSYGKSDTCRSIGYLPDVPEFYSFMNAHEYLSFCGEVTGMARSDINKRSEELLSLVGLLGEKHRIKGYSRGMKQRLGIAQALLKRPKLLICDEQTSALDPIGRKEILDILASVKEQTTVLFSTHILTDVERICTDVAFLNEGVVEKQGKLSEMKISHRSDEYVVQTQATRAADGLLLEFCKMKRIGENELIFNERDYSLFEIMNYLSANRIAINKIERAEPTLESLFMEVLEK
jgi:ABC-2 type transport system ATP-binding protein